MSKPKDDIPPPFEPAPPAEPESDNDAIHDTGPIPLAEDPDAPRPPSRPLPLLLQEQAEREPQPSDTPKPSKKSDVAPTVVSTKPRRRRTRPMRKRDRVTAWLVLILCLALAAMALLIDLNRSEVMHAAEARTVATSVETWQQFSQITFDQWSIEPLVPWSNGQPQLEAPPGVTWLHLLAFTTIDPDNTTTLDLIFHARLVSVVLGLLAIAAIFWIGMSIGGLTTATLATVVCLSMPVFLYYSRLAQPDIPFVSFSLLSIASAFWAIRPLKLPAKLLRQAFGWAMCGLFLGMAMLTGGVGDMPMIVVPLLLVLLLCPHRFSHLMGFIAAGIIAALLTMPWVLYVHERDPHIWQQWFNTLLPKYIEDPVGFAPVLGERLGLILLAVLPWTVWLLTAVVQPFSTSSAGSRLRMFLGWFWFMPLLLLLLISSGHGTLKEILIVLPAAGLVVGQVMRQFVDLSAEGRHARLWRLVRWPHTVILLILSLALPAVGHFEWWLLDHDLLPGPIVAPMAGWFWLGMGGVLTLLALLSMRFVALHYPGRATISWAIWSVAAFTILAIPVVRGPLLHHRLDTEGVVTREIVGDAPVYLLSTEDQTPATWPPQLDHLRLYLGQPIRAASWAQAEQASASQLPVYLLVPEATAPPSTFRKVRQLPDAGLILWRPITAQSQSDTMLESQSTESGHELDAP